jgi:hypothetical protein
MFSRVVIAFGLLLLFVVGIPATATAAAPAWHLTIASHGTNFPAGAVGNTFAGPMYQITATDVGGTETTSDPIVIADTLPAGLTPIETDPGFGVSGSCEIMSQTVTCTYSGPVQRSKSIVVGVAVEVGALPDPTVLTNSATVSGGGGASARASTTTTISSTPASFGLLPGLSGLGGSLTDPNGLPSTQAGSHPNQLTLDFSVPDKRVSTSGAFLAAVGGGTRDLHADLPRGLVVNPNATTVRCVESQLEVNECPADSQVGIASTSVTFGNFGVNLYEEPIYNMVPPADAPAEFGFEVAGAGIYIHVLGGVRPGDYALTAESPARALARSPSKPASILGKTQVTSSPAAPH